MVLCFLEVMECYCRGLAGYVLTVYGIVFSRSSAPVRCALLEVMECYCRGWRDLSNDVTRFYCDTMMDIITD